jgi:hypothetical protein
VLIKLVFQKKVKRQFFIPYFCQLYKLLKMYSFSKIGLSFGSVLFVTTCLLASCDSLVTRDRKKFNPDKICASTENSFECARKIEQALFEIYPDLAERVDGNLFLKLDNGESVQLSDSTGGNDASIKYYSLVDYLELQRLFVVEEQWFEDGTFQIIDRRNGMMTEVIGKPVVSPGEMYFVAINNDLESDNAHNGLQIWSFKDQKLSILYESYPENWAPDSVRWISHKTIELTRQMITDDGIKAIMPIKIHIKSNKCVIE